MCALSKLPPVQADHAGPEERIKQLEAKNADLRRQLWVLDLVTGAAALAVQREFQANNEGG